MGVADAIRKCTARRSCNQLTHCFRVDLTFELWFDIGHGSINGLVQSIHEEIAGLHDELCRTPFETFFKDLLGSYEHRDLGWLPVNFVQRSYCRAFRRVME